MSLSDPALQQRLWMLSRQGDAVGVRQLLQAGAHPLETNAQGWNALHIAAQMGHVAVCEVLRDAGVALDVRDKRGWHPIHLSVGAPDLACCRWFLDQGIALHFRSVANQTLLHLAATLEKPAHCQQLLDWGARVNVRNKDGETPLHIAASLNRAEHCWLLATRGADVGQPNAKGHSPIDLAAALGRIETCLALVSSGIVFQFVESNIPNHLVVVDNGNTFQIIDAKMLEPIASDVRRVLALTPLEAAVEWGHLPALEKVVRDDADPVTFTDRVQHAARWGEKRGGRSAQAAGWLRAHLAWKALKDAAENPIVVTPF